jgi:SAM-dependent methyltransferase
MVTLPASDPEPSYRHREIAQSFGADAIRYGRTRPHYPQALADAILTGLPGNDILDVGIGTGLSALPFLAAGARVTGVEVDARMAELARSRGFPVDIAKFEEWSGPEAGFDAVVAGQTWHWIDPIAGAAKASAVLKPRGRLGLFWNIPEPDPEIAAAFGEVYRSVDTGLPFTPWTKGVSAITGYEQILARAADGILRANAFIEPERHRFDWQTRVTRDAWLDQVPTMGGHNRIPEERLIELLNGLGSIIDNDGGSFTINYATVALVADKREDDRSTSWAGRRSPVHRRGTSSS